MEAVEETLEQMTADELRHYIWTLCAASEENRTTYMNELHRVEQGKAALQRQQEQLAADAASNRGSSEATSDSASASASASTSTSTADSLNTIISSNTSFSANIDTDFSSMPSTPSFSVSGRGRTGESQNASFKDSGLTITAASTRNKGKSKSSPSKNSRKSTLAPTSKRLQTRHVGSRETSQTIGAEMPHSTATRSRN